MARARFSAGIVAVLTLGTVGSSFARDVTVPRREVPKRSTIFKSIETTVTPAETTSCPERFVFVAAIKTKLPATETLTVTYQWQRSDHAIAPVITESWTGSGPHRVSTYWVLASSTGGPLTADLWERLHILSPEDAVSNAAPIRVRCPPPAN